MGKWYLVYLALIFLVVFFLSVLHWAVDFLRDGFTSLVQFRQMLRIHGMDFRKTCVPQVPNCGYPYVLDQRNIVLLFLLYSVTSVNGHLYSETTCIKRPLRDVPKESA